MILPLSTPFQSKIVARENAVQEVTRFYQAKQSILSVILMVGLCNLGKAIRDP